MEPSNDPLDDQQPRTPSEEPDTAVPEPETAVPEPEAVSAEPDTAAPEPDVVSPEPEADAPSPQFDLGQAEPPVPVAPDLEAVQRPEPGAATNLDLPSLDLPYPAPEPRPVPPVPPAVPEAPAASAPFGPGVDYSENLARQAYGEPAAEPAPPAATPYADSPYAAAPGAGAAYAEPEYAQPRYSQPQYDQAPFNQQSYGSQYPGQLVAPSGMTRADENTWATAAHWSSLLLSVVSLPFLGPLLVMLIQGPKSARVRANAVESLNFDLTCLIGILISFVLMIVFIGFLTAPLIGLFWLVMKIVAAVQTGNGQDYRYPLNIRMVK
nr:DUF4870 domain-containing protein [Propionicimonas sp.]